MTNETLIAELVKALRQSTEMLACFATDKRKGVHTVLAYGREVIALAEANTKAARVTACQINHQHTPDCVQPL